MWAIKDYLFKRPMLLCGGFCIIISVMGQLYGLSLPIFAFILMILICLFLASKANRKVAVAGIISAVMLISFTVESSNAIAKQKLNGSKVDGTFTVCDITYKSEGFYRADIEVKSSDFLKHGDKLNVSYYENSLDIGDVFNAELTIQSFDEDYKKSYFSRGIYLGGKMKNFEKTGNSDFVLKAVGYIRDYICDTLFENLEYSEAATLCALVFGDRDYFTDEFYSNVKAAGVSHVMVVSGMHLSITVAFFTFLIEKVLYNRYLKAILQLLVVVVMSALCGFTMSILRAGVMYLLMSVALVIKRPATPENTLGAAVTLILIFSPFAANNISFMLSVLSTFGILCVALPISNYMQSRGLIKRKWLNGMFSAVIVSLSASFLTLPIAIKVFGYISTVSLLSNLLISFAVTVSLWLSIAVLLINPLLPFIAEILFIPLRFIVKYINFVINTLGSLPFAVAFVDSSLWIVAIAVIIIMFLILLTCKKRIDMVKLNKMRDKIIKEGGARLKWR